MNISKHSEVYSKKIGKGTSIWQYCIILEGAIIGKNCNICSHCFIENDVKVGNGVTIKNGVKIFDSVVIEDNVFIGPNVIFTNDVYPRSIRAQHRKKIIYPKTIIHEGSSIGGNTVILPGVKIGKKAIVGAGSVISKNVNENTVVYGPKSIFQRNL